MWSVRAHVCPQICTPHSTDHAAAHHPAQESVALPASGAERTEHREHRDSTSIGSRIEPATDDELAVLMRSAVTLARAVGEAAAAASEIAAAAPIASPDENLARGASIAATPDTAEASTSVARSGVAVETHKRQRKETAFFRPDSPDPDGDDGRHRRTPSAACDACRQSKRRCDGYASRAHGRIAPAAVCAGGLRGNQRELCVDWAQSIVVAAGTRRCRV
jgi:hypothetical protein